MRALPEASVLDRNGVHPHHYVPSLDGIRGIAILLVLLSHARLFGLSEVGGIGVDIFFVLSGYLITMVLRREHGRNGSISLSEFYKHRALRLLPALLLMCGLFVAYSAIFLGNFPKRLQETLEALLYVSNWSRAFDLGTSHHLGHTWSLGIEEQFYLLWPLLLIGLLRMPRPHVLVPATALTLAMAAAAWRITLASEGSVDIQRLYNGFDTRCDAVLIGCALAFLAPRLAALWPIGVAGLVAMIAAQNMHYRLPFASGYTIADLLAALMIAGAVSRASVLIAVLSSAPLVAIGWISYGLYIYHYPIWLILGEDFRLSHARELSMLLTFGLAILSYRYLEQPCLALRHASLAPMATRILAIAGPLCVAAGSITIVWQLAAR